ncbi:hypothetical protein [Rhizobium sp. Leaf341]|uniref:hypothetical protein n=1 Tax=Rhizobium sp. Leaf341 TaxID=1736344 RepID=UPI000713A5D7|nr:hypothetical protein [Rhizobium sp. Leaf341]KQR75770.1 hypothetical protein ASG03_19055 [Rhizobium sp. Leaf341]
MRKALDQTLSTELGQLRDGAKNVLAGSVFANVLDQKLRILEKLATSMELELAILRETEAGREYRTRIEQTATDALADMLPPEGTVIRPDFGRKS